MMLLDQLKHLWKHLRVLYDLLSELLKCRRCYKVLYLRHLHLGDLNCMLPFMCLWFSWLGRLLLWLSRLGKRNLALSLLLCLLLCGLSMWCWLRKEFSWNAIEKVFDCTFLIKKGCLESLFSLCTFEPHVYEVIQYFLFMLNSLNDFI